MRVALTGGATGIGASVAAKLKARGAHVTAFDLNEPQDNVDRWIETDLGNPASIAAATEAAEGPFDALINNAGLPPRDGLEALILKVNYIGLRTFMDGMLARLSPNAAIVNTASRAGAMWRDNIEQVKALMALGSMDKVPAFVAAQDIDAVRAYNLSKEAVIALTIAGTEDMIARKLRMNSVSPAAVSTGILDDFLNAFGERAQKAIARAGRAGEADEIADVIVFLASPESRWIKGQDIVIDGGISAMLTSDMLALRP
ncbi:SDR family oxidoreductase [Hoeflea poritis]|uniref:SDR family oxidoreductase n=1 Tax=Hoeflea poritis TaxID=2993659 RepID=A0ABT4VQT4_9HYPH|nr:SDR family oxidoreductase [Hoeflea poritis]MDA4847062.1 SDR family oxidoreductase [Hoeflea poritis]